MFALKFVTENGKPIDRDLYHRRSGRKNPAIPKTTLVDSIEYATTWMTREIAEKNLAAVSSDYYTFEIVEVAA